MHLSAHSFSHKQPIWPSIFGINKKYRIRVCFLNVSSSLHSICRYITTVIYLCISLCTFMLTLHLGHQLLSGTTIGLELLKAIKTEEAALAKYLLHVSAFAEKTDEDLVKAHDEVARIDKSLSLTISRIEKIEKSQRCLESTVSSLGQKQEELETTFEKQNEKLSDIATIDISQRSLESSLSSLDQRHEELEFTVEKQSEKLSDIETNLNEVGRKVECVKMESTTASKGLTSRVDTLYERVSHIEHYHSSNKPDKIFFYTPGRYNCFVGRKKELTQFERFLCTNENNAIHFVTGLGGSGKTSFAIEFSWSM